MMHGAWPLAASVVSLVQKSLNGVVSNWILMFGYFWVTMSATCSQAFFSTSEPDHMNQVRVTGPPEELPELALPLLPPRGAPRAGAAAVAAAGGQEYDGRGRREEFGETGNSHSTP